MREKIKLVSSAGQVTFIQQIKIRLKPQIK
jgi:hypothetical protein